jgi:hypothetical protein
VSKRPARKIPAPHGSPLVYGMLSCHVMSMDAIVMHRCPVVGKPPNGRTVCPDKPIDL